MIILQCFDLVSVMFNKKWVAKRLTVNLAAQEARKLENYCAATGRPMTDVLRQLIRDKL